VCSDNLERVQENTGRVDIEQWYEYVPESLETGNESKLTIL